MPCDVRHYGDNFNTYHDVLNEIDTYVNSIILRTLLLAEILN